MMKWIVGIFIVTAILGYGLVRYAMSTALRTENPVGFEIIQIADTDGHSFPAGVWYPTQVQPKPTTMLSIVLMDVARNAPISGHDLPLVVISHGNGGDNYADQSAVGSVTWLSGRTKELHTTIDYMLKGWQGHDRIDPERIGAFGFSAGGFTVLTPSVLSQTFAS